MNPGIINMPAEYSWDLFERYADSKLMTSILAVLIIWSFFSIMGNGVTFWHGYVKMSEDKELRLIGGMGVLYSLFGIIIAPFLFLSVGIVFLFIGLIRDTVKRRIWFYILIPAVISCMLIMLIWT